MKSGGFHGIRWISHEIRRISCEIHPKPYKSKCFNQNYSVWWMQERGYEPGFHEILGHSPLPAPPKLKSFCWNIWFYKVLGGFHMKSARFHEIHQISCEIHRISKIWAFAWWSSVGLSFERPIIWDRLLRKIIKYSFEEI